jgi:very-short-patch-repair endonuclease
MSQCPICNAEIEGNRLTCSIKCRNTYNARQRVITTDVPQEGVRYHRRPCTSCGKIRDSSSNLCRDCKPHKYDTLVEHEQFLREQYPILGLAECAKLLHTSTETIRRKVTSMNLVVNPERKTRQYEIVSQYMTENNPMYNAETVVKVKDYWNNHPEEKEHMMLRLNEGKASHMKSQPSKLEHKVKNFLDDIGVPYVHQYLVKTGFIVDFKIENVIIQVDGEYWHGHPRFYPLTQRQAKQKARDVSQDSYLTACGFVVVRIWERDVTYENVLAILENHNLITRK